MSKALKAILREDASTSSVMFGLGMIVLKDTPDDLVEEMRKENIRKQLQREYNAQQARSRSGDNLQGAERQSAAPEAQSE